MPRKIIGGLLAFLVLFILVWVSLPKLPAVLGVSSKLLSDAIFIDPQTGEQRCVGLCSSATVSDEGTSNITVSRIRQTSAVITWTTNNNSSSWVDYWKASDSSYSGDSEGRDDSVRNHIVVLSNLSSGTQYAFNIVTNALSHTRTRYFTTLLDPRVITNTLPKTIVGITSTPSPSPTTPPSIIRINTPAPSTRTLVSVLPPLKIENVRYGSLTSTSVIIYWTTNNASTSKVQFYIGNNSPRSIGKTESVKDHKIILDQLIPDSRYSYRVKSKDSAGQEQTSAVNYFTTPKRQATTGSAPQGSTQTPADENIPADNQDQPSDESIPMDEPADNEQISDQSGITYDMPAEPEEADFDAPPVEDLPAQVDSETNLPTSAPEEQNEVLAALNKSVVAPLAKVVESSPINPLFKSNTFQKTPFYIYILAALVIFFLIKVIIFRTDSKTGKEPPENPDRVHQQSFTLKIKHGLTSINHRLPGVFHKKIFLIGLGIVLIFFVLPQLVFLPLLLTPNTSKNQTGSNSPDYYAEYLNYQTQIDYQEPPKDITAASFNCQKSSLLPDKNKNYLCKNIYQTDENQLKSEVSAKNPDRIFLYGQNIYYDCPAQSSKAKEPVTECYQSAKFIDNWQIRKMQEMFGVEFPGKKLYYHLTETLKQTQDLCGKIGAVNPAAGACLDPNTNSIFTPAYNSNGSMYFGLVSALFFESGTEGTPAVKYKGQIFLPRNCYLTDNHEIIHVINAAVWKNMPTWLDEGLIKLSQNTIRKQTCSPGMKVVQLVKVESDQETFVSETFDPDSLDWEEPLSKGLTNLSEDSSCRKGIFLEIAKNIRNGGNVYLKSLYKALGKNQKTDENSIAKTVWKSTGEDASVKESLLKHECSI